MAKLKRCLKCGFYHAQYACDETPRHLIIRQEYERSLAKTGKSLYETRPWLKKSNDLTVEQAVELFQEELTKIRTRRERVYDRDGWKCLACYSKNNLTLDHIVPLSEGGSNLEDNLQTLCKPCNEGKANSTIDYRPNGTIPTVIRKVGDYISKKKKKKRSIFKTEEEDYNDRR